MNDHSEEGSWVAFVGYRYRHVRKQSCGGGGNAASPLDGSTGPSTWRVGSYPDGQDDYRVGGVSWYEAATYAVFPADVLVAGQAAEKAAAPVRGRLKGLASASPIVF